ncbi:MAG TPA: FAD-linked oxidase C-terminal domain-containing protein [Nocardioidaceae bacterium]|nr:FAD-linked oxidase C-terminal domain-containing protein [Nocardioidaceae bacterium]
MRDLTAELHRHGVTDVDDSSLARAMYSTDASLYRVVPRVVVRPRDTDELVATVAVARETSTPLTMRGAGTSMAGNAVGEGIVVDTSRHLNRVLEIDREARTARVQPGLVHASLQQQALPHGLRYGPDPASHSRCTIGGMLGNNACGARALGYGRSVDNLRGLDAVTIDGTRLSWLDGVPARGADPAGSSVLSRAADVVAADLSTVRTEFAKFGRQVSGYALEHLLPENGTRVDRLLVGSEGTLAVLLEATVDLVEKARHRALAVLGFPSMAEAADAVGALLEHPLVACEGMDGRVVDAYVARRGASGVPELPDGSCWVLAEVTGGGPGEAESKAEKVAATVPAQGSRVVVDESEILAIWGIREDGAGLTGQALKRPSHSGWEDAAVPPANLGAYLRDFDALMDQYGLDGVPYGHLGEGCMHIRIDFRMREPDGRRAFRSFLGDAATLVASHGGTLSGEHGDGRARSELLPAMYSPAALAMFAQVKHVFDAVNLLNPGVLVDPRPADADLRLAARLREPAGLGLRLSDDDGSLLHAVHRCTGIGKCRADGTARGAVMCPSYLATREEKDSTRGRARVLQEMLNGSVVADGWKSPEVHDALDLCLSCKGCARDCPTGIDMASYKAIALHQRFRRRIRPRSHYALGQLPRWARLTQPVARLANAAMNVEPLARVLKTMAGVDQRRSLPPFANRSLRRWARRSGTAYAARTAESAAGRVGTPDVLVWADSFTEHFGPSAGRAAVRVLEAAGLRAAVLDERVCCGLTWVSTGQLDAARRIAVRAVDRLHPYIAGGATVVGLEPSCLATLRSDLGELVDDPRAEQVAAGMRTLAEVLTQAAGWRPPDLSGSRIVVQPHCHHASILGWDADAALLARTGAEITRLGGCCGLAGNFGVERGHYEVSVAVAEHQLLPAVRAAGPDTVVLADGFSCRTQIDDLASVRALHLAELLDRPEAF